MGEQVRCLGYLTEEEVVELYRGATALVFPSFADYTAIPLVEAMVLGTPVVSSNVFSIPEQVGRAGVFFNPFAPEDIAEAIYRVWTDEALRVRLIANGRKRGHELSPGEFRKQWRVLVDEALSKHHRDL
jgi:glycosyltransferase involved in cell wall biosynthesis